MWTRFRKKGQPALAVVLSLVVVSCDTHGDDDEGDYSGTYCVEALNARLDIQQSGAAGAFTLTFTGAISGDVAIAGRKATLTGPFSESETFEATLEFADDGRSFSGSFQLIGPAGAVSFEGSLDGVSEACPVYDIGSRGIPEIVAADFTQLETIQSISRFRSGFGHSYADSFEQCRSMKHYYAPKEAYRKNQTIAIYAPVKGVILAVENDGHGASIGLNNKQVLIKPDSQPAFRFRIFHTDLVSAEFVPGKRISAGDLIGHARIYYEDLGEVATSFDIAVEVNTPTGGRFVSYFDVMEDGPFSAYLARGASSRGDFIISRAERDADPLSCDGESFTGGGTIENWVHLD